LSHVGNSSPPKIIYLSKNQQTHVLYRSGNVKDPDTIFSKSTPIVVYSHPVKFHDIPQKGR